MSAGYMSPLSYCLLKKPTSSTHPLHHSPSYLPPFRLNDAAPTHLYTLSLHDALPIYSATAVTRQSPRHAPEAFPRGGCRCPTSSTGCHRRRSFPGAPTSRRAPPPLGERAPQSRFLGGGARGGLPRSAPD